MCAPDQRPQTRSYSVADLKRLIEFYLACVEEEDRRSLRIPLGSHGRSFIAPWTGTEPLLHPAAEHVDIAAADPADFRFLTGLEGQAGASERFFYGYPLHLEADDYLAPLFILEVEVSREGNGFRVLPQDANALTVNRHLLGLHRLPMEEQQAVEDMLQESFGSFSARLAAVFEYLDEEIGSLNSDRIEPLPNRGAQCDCWINCPILFRSVRSAFTDKLRRELSTFLRYPRVLDAAAGTALTAFLGDTTFEADRAVPIVEVMPLNPEQARAAEEALARPLTVVTGPPGTGKSQVVIDLLASCAASGRAVLFCSKNNKAVDVVRERLRELLGKEHDWTLRLGNRHHLNATKEEMTQRIDACQGPEPVPQRPQFDEWDQEVDLAYRQRDQLNRIQDELNETQEALRSAARRLPEQWVTATPPDFPDRLSLSDVTALRNRASSLAGEGRAGPGLRIVRFLFPGWLLRRLRRRLEALCAHVPDPIATELRESVETDGGFRQLAEAFARLLALTLWLEARDRLADLESRFSRMPTADQLARQIRQSKSAKAEAGAAWLRDHWTSRITSRLQTVRELIANYFNQNETLYTARGQAFVQRLDALSFTIRELGEYLPVWIVTNLSARRSLPLKPALFDLVIIDEASQCDIASALPLLFRARRAAIIGDPHQLRHITLLRDREEHEIAEQSETSELLDDWSYIHLSLYDRAARAYRRSGKEPVFLREHFRSWPLIAEFSNRSVYRSRLALQTDLNRLRDKLNGRELGVVWHPVRGKIPRTQRSAWNPAEVRAVCKLLQDWWDTGFLQRTNLRFGIVTPFRRQVEQLGESLRNKPWWEALDQRLILGTAHQFQGDECDVMIFSTVISVGMRETTRNWLTSTEHLLNVAITRARGVLHVVGDRQACEAAGGLLGEFSRYVNEMASPAAAGNPARARLADLLGETGLWYQPRFPLGRDRFDFLVVSPFGTRYDVEIDGRQTHAPEHTHADKVRDQRVTAAGYAVMRIGARDVLNRPDCVRQRLARLV